jgi:hypothetical protein
MMQKQDNFWQAQQLNVISHEEKKPDFWHKTQIQYDYELSLRSGYSCTDAL